MSTFYEKYKDSFGKVQVITEKTTFYHLRKSGFISVSLFNCFEQNGYVVVGDVLKQQGNDICKIRGFGQGKLKELRNFFKYNSELFEIDPYEI
tara:strand:+ start:446 stop:724 length:279 start_codon:yes stop_codon:yes gene_type:complete